MKPLSVDTTQEMQHRHFELMRRVPPWKRLNLAFELTQSCRQLVLADLRHRFPDADEKEIRQRFISRVLPRDDVIRAYGFDPLAEHY
ncbi:MAG TPA: hypothetical protein VJU86_03060 [Pyrinomonadaceae bacterium]|nr:hypothetical protein [Pyrinomonadaceae bacterium]